mgnify:CR=1 FL=1
MNEQVLLDIRGAIATLTLNRPQAMNSLGLEMGRAFLARVEELQKAATSRNSTPGSPRRRPSASAPSAS